MTGPPMQQPTTWFEQYCVHRFDELAEQLGCVEKKLDGVRQLVPRLEERVRMTAVLFGLLGGFLPALAALAYLVLKRGT